MKYFINDENHKVRLAWATPSVDGEIALCWDVDGNEYNILMSEVLDDGEPDWFEVSIPIEFPNTFVPPETFDNCRCMWCPFFCAEEGVKSYCSHKHYEDQHGCPIRKHF